MDASLAVQAQVPCPAPAPQKHKITFFGLCLAVPAILGAAVWLCLWLEPIVNAPTRPGFHRTAAGIIAAGADGHQLFGLAEYEGSDYYFDENGILQTGWLDVDGKRLYALPSGELARGLQQIDGETYYFTADHAMRTGFFSANGVYYFFDRETGAARDDGFVTENGDTWYATDDGTLCTGWQDIDGRRYHFNAIGHLQTGYQEIDGRLYHFSEDGVLQTGFHTVDGVLCWFGEDGAIRPGYQTYEGADRLFDGQGRILDGWQTIAGTQYYYDFGVKLTGEQELDGEVWNFGADGVLRTGWLDQGADRYYYDDHGYYYTGWHKIGKNRYHFEDNGIMTVSKTLDGYYIDANGVASKKLTAARTVQECYDYVRHYLSYRRIPSDTPENMLQQALTRHYGACYHYATLFNHVLNQAGIENEIVWGLNPKGGTHVWNKITKTGLIWDSCNGYRGITEEQMAKMGYTW